MTTSTTRTSVRSALPHPRRLVEFGPHGGAHRVAVRAGVAMAVPLVGLQLTGHIDLALYAVFGAFTALYGRAHTHLARLQMQAAAGAALVTCVVIGTAIGASVAREWIVVPVAAVVAGVATIVSDALDWHPPGALFFVFALAACASVPAEASRIPVALALAAASALVAMAVSTAGLVRPAARERARAARESRSHTAAGSRAHAAAGSRVRAAAAQERARAASESRAHAAAARERARAATESRAHEAARSRARAAAARERVATRFGGLFAAAIARPHELGRVAAIAVAVLVAGAIPTATGLGHPYWAMVSAVAALGAADVAGHLVRAGHRVGGTLLGVGLAAVLLAVSSSPVVLIAFVVLLQVAAELFVMRNYGLTMVFVTPLALIMAQLAHPGDEWALLRDRTLETLLGAAVGVAVSVALATLRARRAAAERPSA
ncbi:FUSC family protein [Herbiconiux sp. A18JL235]|uniref:FUSC family protein n=1 Tax=Herbiconiux sp. A18JL235 TaxID=3152363 RepID=A0AB39BHR0_9MICO